MECRHLRAPRDIVVVREGLPIRILNKPRPGARKAFKARPAVASIILCRCSINRHAGKQSVGTHVCRHRKATLLSSICALEEMTENVNFFNHMLQVEATTFDKCIVKMTVDTGQQNVR